ncbi:pyridoxal 5'-phosphate synthase [Algiphilus sp. W345]|uniref:Pyridoxal 5'-phosphate synthase n=1 Tax=Banduia mediterranea TaxID=3075609 RepID=A0ABU2WHN1_9GAMM|nr:pyridoxal 5'-phosphate synthase [Algiphilus sp. W345]MDT0496587.1 pyridoxal 5'-phosphate synthase [Algiphilus sp. W345]
MTKAQTVEPVTLLRDIIQQGHANDDADANAAALATADSASGRPSVRTVYVQIVEQDIVFFVNARSGKGRQIEWNPYVGLCFFWRYMRRQVIVEGRIELLDPAAADACWRDRPRESRLAAHASRQHAHTGDERAMKARLHEEKQRFNFSKVVRPEHWLGYKLLPEHFEFWETGWGRLSSRRSFERQPDGTWVSLRQDP